MEAEVMEGVGQETAPDTSMESTPDAGADAPAEADWDGSLDSLVAQPWIPESARQHLERHLDDYATTRTRADFLHRMFEADDRTAELTKELESLRQAMSAATKERDDWRSKAADYETRVTEVEDDREFERLKAAYPDIYDDCRPDEKNKDAYTGAWPMMLDLMVRGYDEETAAKMARTFLPASAPSTTSAPAAPAPSAPTPRQVEVPKSVAAASRGGNNPSSTVNAAEANESFEQRVRRMMREAQEREG